jgi:hypothetical protein
MDHQWTDLWKIRGGAAGLSSLDLEYMQVLYRNNYIGTDVAIILNVSVPRWRSLCTDRQTQLKV